MLQTAELTFISRLRRSHERLTTHQRALLPEMTAGLSLAELADRRGKSLSAISECLSRATRTVSERLQADCSLTLLGAYCAAHCTCCLDLPIPNDYLKHCLNLSWTQQRVLALAIQGVSIKGISLTLGRSRNTVGQRLTVARSKIEAATTAPITHFTAGIWSYNHYDCCLDAQPQNLGNFRHQRRNVYLFSAS